MWDWRQQTSNAGYSEAPRFFRINPKNYSGRRLYKLIGPDAKLLVTNACRELVTKPSQHGKPDPQWLADNLAEIETRRPDSAPIHVLLVCGKVAQQTFKDSGYKLKHGKVIEIPHPAARGPWNKEFIEKTARQIQRVKVPALLRCPAQIQGGVCQGFEACYHRGPGDPCPYECDACKDVSPDLNDEGVCENCREHDGE